MTKYLNKPKPVNVLRSIAEHFAEDARDFVERFDLTWGPLTSKTARIKSFVDLMMACECALKAHIAIGHESCDPHEIYSRIRGAGHHIDRLAVLANFMESRSVYEEVSARLGNLSVFVRYSLESYDLFFPLARDWSETKVVYSETIGSDAWIRKLRSQIQQLIDRLNDELGGLVSNDVNAIFLNEVALEELLQEFASRRKAARQS
ncbi:hypothetical protein U875_09610 [Pandoraea pnomenusa 3kgm]|uniref:hypothetical protein n=1 Tax=Pandoraea pnomenusa TaxID=93220 RepID=UPI0003C76066|nr:hypothetical protein [Pandoraea pnomenusa]AHB08387.1 hypothetical protein U875_09610 [Pandoraea pnomenusa 3kgm]